MHLLMEIKEIPKKNANFCMAETQLELQVIVSPFPDGRCTRIWCVRPWKGSCSHKETLETLAATSAALQAGADPPFHGPTDKFQFDGQQFV